MDDLEKLKMGIVETEEERSLRQLYDWLQYEGFTMFGGFGIFWAPYVLILKVLSILAVLFTPYLLWKLAKAGWYKTIAGFTVLVIIPLIVSQLMQQDATINYFLWSIGSLTMFYLFTWILRYVIGERLTELEAVRELEYERKKRNL